MSLKRGFEPSHIIRWDLRGYNCKTKTKRVLYEANTSATYFCRNKSNMLFNHSYVVIVEMHKSLLNQNVSRSGPSSGAL